jgi:hypothetical protein
MHGAGLLEKVKEGLVVKAMQFGVVHSPHP